MNAIADQIARMTNLITANTEAPPTDPPPTETPPTEPPPTSAPETEVPPTEAPPTDPPKTEAPPTEAPTTEAPSDEMDELREELRLLREEKALRKKETTSAPPTAPPPTDAPIDDEDFLGEIDLDEMTRDPAKFNEVLNAVMKKGVELGRAEGRQRHTQTVLSIPDMVKNITEIRNELEKASTKFYEDNEDLKPFSKVVAVVFGEKMAEDPGKSYSEIMKDVEPEVRKRLDLQKKAVKKKDDSPPLPRNRGKGPRGKQPPDTSSLASEIDDMNKSLET